MKSVCIVGAGTQGLSMALKLYEELNSKVDITVISEAFLHQTTSIGSGGLWKPYQILGTPDELVDRWGKVAFEHFLKLYYSPHAAEAGIQLMPSFSLLTQEEWDEFTLPSWKDIVFNFQVLTLKDAQKMVPNLPERFVAGYTFTTLVIDQKYYMQYLMKQLRQHGVKFEQHKLTSISELDNRPFDAIINCTGLGSAQLVKDKEMYPISGLVLRVKLAVIFYYFTTFSRDLT